MFGFTVSGRGLRVYPGDFAAAAAHGLARLDQGTHSMLPLFSCLPKYSKLAIVFPFPGFFSRLHMTSSLDCSLGSNVSTPPTQPALLHTIHSLHFSPQLLSSPSFMSSCHLELFLSVLPELAPVPRGFSDHSCFWEVLGVVGGKSH